MVRLSKRVEYGLIAIRHIAANPAGVMTAKEIAGKYQIPYELLAKVLQRLSRAGLIGSQQGVRGGYTLAKNPNDVSVSMIIGAIEGTNMGITQCVTDGPESCDVYNVCTIKAPLSKVQSNIENAFNSMTLAQIV